MSWKLVFMCLISVLAVLPAKVEVEEEYVARCFALKREIDELKEDCSCSDTDIYRTGGGSMKPEHDPLPFLQPSRAPLAASEAKRPLRTTTLVVPTMISTVKTYKLMFGNKPVETTVREFFRSSITKTLTAVDDITPSKVLDSRNRVRSSQVFMTAVPKPRNI